MPHTLLLADDSVTIQRVIELTFADEDVTVVAVSDGDQAIERLEASPPDIVLADIGMPGKNGYEVAQYIRRSPRLSHIPVVLLTGAFEPVDQARANDAGCDGVLAKPFEPQLVIGRVKELLAKARRPAAAGPELDLSAADIAEFSAPPMPPLATPAADSIWAPPLADQRNAAPFVDPPAAAAAPVARAELNDYFDRLDAAFSTLSSNPPAPAAPAGNALADPIPGAPPASIATDIDWFGSKAAETSADEPWDLPVSGSGNQPAPDLALSDTSATLESRFDLLDPAAPLPSAETEPAVEAISMEPPDERLAPIEESAPIEPQPGAPPPAAAVASESWPGPSFAAADPAPFTAPSAVAPALELPLPNPPPLPALADAFAALLAAEQGEPLSAASGTWPESAPPAAAETEELIEEVTRRVLERLSDTVVRDAVADVASKVAERLIREEIARIKASIK